MAVCAARILGRSLLASGDRCTMMTKAAPGSGGRLSSNVPKAVTPPAEAPMPTTVRRGGDEELFAAAPDILFPNHAPTLRRWAATHYAAALGLGHSYLRQTARGARSTALGQTFR